MSRRSQPQKFGWGRSESQTPSDRISNPWVDPHQLESDGGSTANLLRHSATPHPKPHDHWCRVSRVQKPQNTSTVHDPRISTPDARNSRSQCMSISFASPRAPVFSDIQAETSRTRHEIIQDMQGFPMADEPVPSRLIKQLQSIVSGQQTR